MKITKRDGREVVFDQEKISNAVLAAAKACDGRTTDETETLADVIAETIANLVELSQEVVNVEDIQDKVEELLMVSDRKDIARAYITYRNERTRQRERDSELMRQIGQKLNAETVENQNANVDERSFGGRMGEARSIMVKRYALDNLVSKKAMQHHDNNEIYIHDLDSYAVGMHNCLSVPIDDLLANGFVTRQTDVRPAGSVKSALQLVAVIFQLQSLCQFGGVSATHLDWSMVPYVRKSFAKHYRDGMRYLEGDTTYQKDGSKSIVDATYSKNKRVYEYALDMTIEETHQAVEAMYHNLNLGRHDGNVMNIAA